MKRSIPKLEVIDAKTRVNNCEKLSNNTHNKFVKIIGLYIIFIRAIYSDRDSTAGCTTYTVHKSAIWYYFIIMSRIRDVHDNATYNIILLQVHVYANFHRTAYVFCNRNVHTHGHHFVKYNLNKKKTLIRPAMCE